MNKDVKREKWEEVGRQNINYVNSEEIEYFDQL